MVESERIHFFTNCFIIHHLTSLSDHTNDDCLLKGLMLVFLAVSSKAQKSISALCQSRDAHAGILRIAIPSNLAKDVFSESLKRKISTLLIFVSITGTSLFQANAKIAAEVYGHIPGNCKRSSLV